ncbi:hypothetical protein EUZ85_15025 [Hahella sp. KA22]|uniref:hypothetical protein n=1 Tax=unclassified Hahella TaxID=2624107 RepID=UPI000FDEDE86|nr:MULTISPECIES: hypothetical protein [unclassified Hahella]AZZ91973.1 hypothetical protein ENC22_12460 [Hahella sp. KA22]QAY55344.1 hypothetical protein EUZ85_15025 [Hahella sp. KA22]WLQ17014.1 hypothetical protein O5O45_13930 [Hahella sp. HNIBRBA332]
MRKALVTATAILALSGCCLDSSYSVRGVVPTNIIIKNNTNNTINIEKFYAAPDANAMFSMESFRLHPSEDSEVLQMTISSFDAIVDRKFYFFGACEGSESQLSPGENFRLERSEGYWLATIIIDDCSYFHPQEKL